jgi:hypothetical protein
VHLLALIIRIYHDARSPECQILYEDLKWNAYVRHPCKGSKYCDREANMYYKITLTKPTAPFVCVISSSIGFQGVKYVTTTQTISQCLQLLKYKSRDPTGILVMYSRSPSKTCHILRSSVWILTDIKRKISWSFNGTFTKNLISAVFWTVTQRVVVVLYRCFGTNYRIHRQGSIIQVLALASWFLTLDDGSDVLSRNVGKELPQHAT